MSSEFLKSNRAANEVLPGPLEGKRAEVARYSQLLAEQQRGLQRAMSKGDRKSADRIQGVIKNLQNKHERTLGQLRDISEE